MHRLDTSGGRDECSIAASPRMRWPSGLSGGGISSAEQCSTRTSAYIQSRSHATHDAGMNRVLEKVLKHALPFRSLRPRMEINVGAVVGNGHGHGHEPCWDTEGS